MSENLQILWSNRSCEFFPREGGKRRFKNTVSLVYFLMSKFLGYHVQGQRSSGKCECWDRGYILIAVRTHLNYLSPTGNEDLFSSQYRTHLILPSEFWISIDNGRKLPTLNKIWKLNNANQFVFLLFFANGSSLLFKASNLIQI